MGTHPRLGKKSLLFTAFAGIKPLVKEIFSYIEATPIEFKNIEFKNGYNSPANKL